MTPELAEFINHGISIHEKMHLRRMPKSFAESYIVNHDITDPDQQRYLRYLIGSRAGEVNHIEQPENIRAFCAAVYTQGCAYSLLAKFYKIAPTTMLRKVQRHFQVLGITPERQLNNWTFDKLDAANRIYTSMLEDNPLLLRTIGVEDLGKILNAKADQQLAEDNTPDPGSAALL
jgi:hypothetical protein